MHRKLKEKSTSALFTAAFFQKVRDIYLFTGGQRSLCTLEPMCGVQMTTYAGQFPLSAMWGSRTYAGQFPPSAMWGSRTYEGQFPQELRGVEEALSD